MAKILAVLCVCITLFSCRQDQQKPDKGKDQLNNVCNVFMQEFVTGNTEKAFDLLKQNSVVHPSTIDTLMMKVLEQKKTTFPQFGKMLSYEFIEERKVGNFITKRFYVIKFSLYFLKVDFTLYNNGKKWAITSFHYNEEVDELLR